MKLCIENELYNTVKKKMKVLKYFSKVLDRYYIFYGYKNIFGKIKYRFKDAFSLPSCQTKNVLPKCAVNYFCYDSVEKTIVWHKAVKKVIQVAKPQCSCGLNNIWYQMAIEKCPSCKKQLEYDTIEINNKEKSDGTN